MVMVMVMVVVVVAAAAAAAAVVFLGMVVVWTKVTRRLPARARNVGELYYERTSQRHAVCRAAACDRASTIGNKVVGHAASLVFVASD
jgi:hypothetical protein